MTLKLNERYPGRANNPSPEYPQGSFKNRTAPGAQDGTYLEQDWCNDQQAFFSSLLTEAGITANGQVDEVGACQTYDALLQVIQDNAGDTLDTVRIDVASASNVNLTTSAPDTRHINITGTTNISSFTVGAGRCYFVRFDGALTLLNSGTLVTQRGANITTAAGDTCVIRATAANTVEILCGDFLSEAAVGTRGQTWQDVSGSRVVATNYTNTTGRPIMVSVTRFTPGSTLATVTLSVDGVVASSGYHSGQARATLCAIVPPGGVYRVDGGESTSNWAELR